MKRSFWRWGVPIIGALLAVGIWSYVGNAASLAAGATSVAAGTATISACATTALSVAQTVPTSSVTAVVVSGFPAGCGGASVQVAVNNGTASSTGSGTVPSGGGSVSMTLAAAVPVAMADQIDIVVLGP